MSKNPNMTALVTVQGSRLTDEVQESLRPYAQWVIVNRRRVGIRNMVLLDMIFDRQDWGDILALLPTPGRQIIAVHRRDNGKRMLGQAINKTEWAKIARSRFTPDPVDPENNPPIETRPTAAEYAQQHTWLGWPRHSEDEED